MEVSESCTAGTSELNCHVIRTLVLIYAFFDNLI